MSIGVREAAEILEVHENTIRHWVKDGILIDIRIPGSSFIRLSQECVVALAAQRNASEIETLMFEASEALALLKTSVEKAKNLLYKYGED